ERRPLGDETPKALLVVHGRLDDVLSDVVWQITTTGHHGSGDSSSPSPKGLPIDSCCPPGRMITTRTFSVITSDGHVVADDGERDDGGGRTLADITRSRLR
ncbi:MAG TPA: hypothetical protein VIJ34_12870, partial [Acidimicrobiales bacterium]